VRIHKENSNNVIEIGRPPLCAAALLTRSAIRPRCGPPDGLRPGRPALRSAHVPVLPGAWQQVDATIVKTALANKTADIGGPFSVPSLCRRGGAGVSHGKAETPGHPIAISAVPKAICQSRARLHSPFAPHFVFTAAQRRTNEVALRRSDGAFCEAKRIAADLCWKGMVQITSRRVEAREAAP